MFDSCRLHESEIRGQGNQRFFPLSSSLSRLVVAACSWSLSGRKIKKNLWDQGSVFPDWWKSQEWSWNLIRMARWWFIAAIVLWLCSICWCSKNKLSTILIAKIVNLARFVTWKNIIEVFLWIFYPYILFMTAIDYNNVLAKTKTGHITPLPPHNGYHCTTATFFCPQGGCFGEVWL